jgi:adenosylcobinamide-GDP ribazoletransferase
MRKRLNAFLTAVQFLTRLPVPGGMSQPGANLSLLQESVVFFPLVGGLIGLSTGAVVWAASHVWPVLVAVLIGLVLEALLTGALHEDAVADCCDAFGGGRTREDVLRILKDSRVGSFGALGLTLAVLLRAGCLLGLERTELLPVAAASGALGRWAGLVLMMTAPPLESREGLGRAVGARTGLWQVVVGALLAAPTCWYAWLEPLRFGGGLIAVLVGALAWAWYVRRRLGGTTGDCIGLACYLGQVLLLLAVVLRCPPSSGE